MLLRPLKINCATEKCPDMILLTYCYHHRGPLVLATYDPTAILRKSRCVKFFLLKTYTVQRVCTATTASVSSTTCSSSHRNELHNSPVGRDSAAAGAVCPTYK